MTTIRKDARVQVEHKREWLTGWPYTVITAPCGCVVIEFEKSCLEEQRDPIKSTADCKAEPQHESIAIEYGGVVSFPRQDLLTESKD